MAERSYELVTEDAADQLHDQPIAGVIGGSPIMGLWMHERSDIAPAPHLPHWYSHILMRCRLALYNRMHAEIAAGNRPLMTNFDSVITIGPPTQPTTEEDEPGTWKQNELHELRIVAPRSYTSLEKTRLPGVKRG